MANEREINDLLMLSYRRLILEREALSEILTRRGIDFGQEYRELCSDPKFRAQLEPGFALMYECLNVARSGDPKTLDLLRRSLPLDDQEN